MEIIDQGTLLKKFKPYLETTSRRWYLVLSGLAIIFFIGIAGLIRQITQGHIVTGMRDNVVWGVYIVNFIFFIGILKDPAKAATSSRRLEDLSLAR